MSEIAVNASPLINLSTLGFLQFLKDFHSNTIIPPAVWEEVVVQGGKRPGVQAVTNARDQGWLELVEPSNEVLVTTLTKQLDIGEAETIVVALERSVDWILLDESEGREMATGYELNVTGTIGILLKALRKEKIESIEKPLNRLRKEANFRISSSLYEKVLSEADRL